MYTTQTVKPKINNLFAHLSSTNSRSSLFKTKLKNSKIGNKMAQ